MLDPDSKMQLPDPDAKLLKNRIKIFLYSKYFQAKTLQY